MMKVTVACCLFMVGSGAKLNAQPHENHVTPPHENHVALAVESKYGNPKCPCIGFDNVQGEVMVMIGGKFVSYPGDLGSRCHAWDNGLEPIACMPGQTPGKDNGWCAQKWCYVDPRNCDIDVLPKMVTAYLPTARYKNMPLFYSYETCGSKDLWATAEPATGSYGCRCVGFDNQAGNMKFQLGAGKTALYPAEAGGSCAAWDLDNNPACAVKGKKPDWCEKKWCFVDPCSCKTAVPPQLSAYLPTASMQGKAIYFSYETCGESYVGSDLCSEKRSETDCTAFAKCGWNGSKCLGKELLDHSVCSAPAQEPTAAQLVARKAGPAAEVKQLVGQKSGAVSARPMLVVVALALAAVMA